MILNHSMLKIFYLFVILGLDPRISQVFVSKRKIKDFSREILRSSGQARG